MKKEIVKWFSSKQARNVARFVHMPDLSYGRRGTGNVIAQGDNIDALKALSAVASGQIRCIYIDPPYNNRERYNHYSDDLSHEAWLESITLRLKYFAELLSEDGSLWISIDDREVHYLKVAADKILNRQKFMSTIIWEQRTTRENRRAFSNNHEYLLVYAQNPVVFRETRHRLDFTAEAISRYKNPDNDQRGPWQSVSANVQAGHATPSQFYEVISPNGRRYTPPNGRCWVYDRERMQEEILKNNVWFGKDGNGVPRLKVFLHNGGTGLTPHTLWLASEVGTSKSAKKHSLQMFPRDPVFDTPKPEHLIHRILNIATDPGDLVLDAYLGSGTTAAVAHKMGRQYVGIEQGDHAITHCAHRLRLVVDGEEGGVSKLVGWNGGGGFDFFRLG
ncbi:MAG: site-specific DNA-methyltransferase [Desulfobaccales bacterium]|jgi:adenine-specific DNA-methyltransferase